MFEKLVDFIRKKSGNPKAVITRDTLIEDDLGVTGDDAAELIQDFARMFKVNIEDFDFEKYFFPEPSLFPVKGNRESFTVGHLEKAVIAGRLDEDVINS